MSNNTGCSFQGSLQTTKISKELSKRSLDAGKLLYCFECGTCTENCPVEIPNEFNMNLGFRKAIFVSFSQTVPLLCTIGEEHCLKHAQFMVGGG